MKVLHVVRGLSNSSGTTHIVVPLAEEQARQGMDVTVFFAEKDGQEPIVPDPSLVTSRCFRLSLPMSNPGVSFAFARAMDEDIRSFDFVHIHAVWNFPTYYAMRAAARAGVPYMVAPQGSFEPWALAQSRWRKRLYGRFTEFPLLNRACCLQALTAKEAEQFRSIGLTAPSVVIPNGIDECHFDREVPPLATQLGFDEGEKMLMYLSRVHPKKGLDVLVRAFARFARAHPMVRLIVAGDDAGTGYLGEMKALARVYGIADRCSFLGELRGQKKFDALLGADALVLSSHSEGLPVAVVEGMAAGLPVVITPGCNIPEVIEWGAGYVVDPRPDAVATALDELFSHPEGMRCKGANARRLVHEKFAWSKIAAQMHEAYAAVVCHRAA